MNLDLSSTTWFYIGLFAGLVCLIAVFGWGWLFTEHRIDWQSEIDREQRRLRDLRDLPRGER